MHMHAYVLYIRLVVKLLLFGEENKIHSNEYYLLCVNDL